MKTLKFSENMIPLITSGGKTATWRLFDDKDLKSGDEVVFLNSETRQPFAKAVLTEVKEKIFKDLSKEDNDGHERFESEEEMYKIYSDYYKTEVNSSSPLKIIKFKLLKDKN